MGDVQSKKVRLWKAALELATTVLVAMSEVVLTALLQFARTVLEEMLEVVMEAVSRCATRLWREWVTPACVARLESFGSSLAERLGLD
tara:strand:+ start:34721 stop:34984 length:264 start_codon:yes stop_codon:yes gene_type:complete